MKHYKASEKKIQTLSTRLPEKMTIDGQIHYCFRDILHNLLVNQLQNNTLDVNAINEQIKHKSERPLSPRHRKRFERRLRRLSGIR